MYAGIAKGRRNAQANTFRPGKSHIAVNHAPPTPRNSVPNPTPSIKNNEFKI
jgi:hypothetical protein